MVNTDLLEATLSETLTGADYLSSGALTHSAKAADISLLVDNIKENIS